MSNVTTLPGSMPPITGKPNMALANAIREVLRMVESGELQSFIGTGFTINGSQFQFMGDYHHNIYETLGSLVWIQAAYQKRHPEGWQ